MKQKIKRILYLCAPGGCLVLFAAFVYCACRWPDECTAIASIFILSLFLIFGFLLPPIMATIERVKKFRHEKNNPH